MLEHVSLRCRDARRSRDFYEKALAPLGYALSKTYDGAFGFRQGGRHDFWVTGGEVGTPTHLAFHAQDEASVEAFHRAALAAGGRDNGAPGRRADYGFAAFVLDPDGHNIEAVVWPDELPRHAARRTAARKPAKGRRKASPPRAPGSG
jgi:catechol 2,3-dioxygenase-like lactoylglutathione lyase family enzyme